MYFMDDLTTAKSEIEADNITVEQSECDIIGLCRNDVGRSNNSYELAVMIQFLEYIQNQNHSL